MLPSAALAFCSSSTPSWTDPEVGAFAWNRVPVKRGSECLASRMRASSNWASLSTAVSAPLERRVKGVGSSGSRGTSLDDTEGRRRFSGPSLSFANKSPINKATPLLWLCVATLPREMPPSAASRAARPSWMEARVVGALRSA
eukprot:scaffold251712_cov33-Tisochrysis_lutea.AAC.2